MGEVPGTKPVERIDAVHPTVKDADQSLYEIWPTDKQGEWTERLDLATWIPKTGRKLGRVRHPQKIVLVTIRQSSAGWKKRRGSMLMKRGMFMGKMLDRVLESRTKWTMRQRLILENQ